jgi:hypothetical protein
VKGETPFWLALGGGAALGAYAIHRSVRGEVEVTQAAAPAARAEVAAPGAGRVVVVPGSGCPVGHTQRWRPVTRKFDPLFAKYGVPRGLPVPYLRALAKRESNMNPAEQTGPAWGLMQVVEVVRKDFNRRHGTSYPRPALLDAETNVRVATWLLSVIADSYERNHGDTGNMSPDWSNPCFVELLTAGWNGGWSERGGMGRVVSYLERRGHRSVTLDLVHANARAAGAVRFLSEPARLKWSKSVVQLYLSELQREPQT